MTPLTHTEINDAMRYYYLVWLPKWRRAERMGIVRMHMEARAAWRAKMGMQV